MKIRQGFVSNSSTTSFCIYGSNTNNITNDTIDVDNDCWSDPLYDYCDKNGLEYECSDFDSWVGISWKNIKDDETGAQFKARIEGKLFKLGIKPEKCHTYEEAWRNG